MTSTKKNDTSKKIEMAKERVRRGLRKAAMVGGAVVTTTAATLMLPSVGNAAFKTLRDRKLSKELKVLQQKSTQAEDRQVLSVMIDSEQLEALQKAGFDIPELPKNDDFEHKVDARMTCVGINNEQQKEVGGLSLYFYTGDEIKFKKIKLFAYEGDTGDSKLVDFVKEIAKSQGQEPNASIFKMLPDETYAQYQNRQDQTYYVAKQIYGSPRNNF